MPLPPPAGWRPGWPPPPRPGCRRRCSPRRPRGRRPPAGRQHLRGVQAAAGADGQLAAPSASSRMVTEVSHPLNLSQEGGDILHILLSCARLVHEGQGHGGHSDFPVLIAVHPLVEQPLHLKPRPALGAEVALIERTRPCRFPSGRRLPGGCPPWCCCTESSRYRWTRPHTGVSPWRG